MTAPAPAMTSAGTTESPTVHRSIWRVVIVLMSCEEKGLMVNPSGVYSLPTLCKDLKSTSVLPYTADC